MQGSRLYSDIFSKKPRLILDSRFPVKDKLNIGDKGQLMVDLTVVSLDMIDNDGSEEMVTSFEVNSAEIFEHKDSRI